MERHEEKPLKGLIEEMKKDLGINEAPPQEVLDAMKEKLVSEGKEKGEPTEEVMKTCLAGMAKLKEPKLKGGLILTMITHLPLEEQVAIIEAQKEIAAQVFLARSTQKGIKELLLAAAMAKRLKDEQ